MAYPSRFPSAENMLLASPVSRSTRSLPLAARIVSIVEWIGDYIETMADYYAAAAMYEQLSGLSDAELRRRGLSRDALVRDVCAASDRMAGP